MLTIMCIVGFYLIGFLNGFAVGMLRLMRERNRRDVIPYKKSYT